MKDKSEVTTNGRAVFYTILYPMFRQAALDCGYALGLHGSMASDMDIVCMAWTPDAKPKEDLIKALSDCIDGTVWKPYHFEMKEKEHGRLCYTLSIYTDFYIDVSVYPPINK